MGTNADECFFMGLQSQQHGSDSLGELPVQDAHVHFFSHKFYSTLALQKKADSVEALASLLNFEIPAAPPVATGRSLGR